MEGTKNDCANSASLLTTNNTLVSFLSWCIARLWSLSVFLSFVKHLSHIYFMSVSGLVKKFNEPRPYCGESKERKKKKKKKHFSKSGLRKWVHHELILKDVKLHFWDLRLQRNSQPRKWHHSCIQRYHYLSFLKSVILGLCRNLKILMVFLPAKSIFKEVDGQNWGKEIILT